MAKDAAIANSELIDDDETKAKLRVNNPTGDRALQYEVVKKHVKKTYPQVVLTNSLGEGLITHPATLDRYHKGYQRGSPDLELKCKVVG